MASPLPVRTRYRNPRSQRPRPRVLGRLPEGHVCILAVHTVQSAHGVTGHMLSVSPEQMRCPLPHVWQAFAARGSWAAWPGASLRARPPRDSHAGTSTAGSRLWIRPAGTVPAACQIRAASRTIAAANGSMYSTTMGPIECAVAHICPETTLLPTAYALRPRPASTHRPASADEQVRSPARRGGTPLLRRRLHQPAWLRQPHGLPPRANNTVRATTKRVS
jgi:hypothetical protein